MSSNNRYVVAGVAAAGFIGAVGVAAWHVADRVLARKVLEGTELQQRQPGARRAVEQRSIVLLWSAADQKLGKQDVKDILLSIFAQVALPLSQGLVIYIDDPENTVSSSAPNIKPLAPNMCAMVSAKLSAAGERTCTESLVRLGFKCAVYHVDSHVYTDYGEYSGPATKGWQPTLRRYWPVGTRSPYPVTITCFPRPHKFQSRDEWVDLWWRMQSPMSEMIQPRVRYIRNAVSDRPAEGAPAYDGIVVEVWPTAWHIMNPFLFFDARGPWELIVHISVMMRSVLQIMDLSQIHGVTMGEYIMQ